MLAVSGEPFDSEDWLFEIKWDGVRALVFHDDDGKVWIRNRRGTRIDDRYPDLADAVRKLPRGTVLDGEIIVLGDDGMPDFPRVLEREQGRGAARLQTLVRERPACFVAFDRLYASGTSMLDETLEHRRAALMELEISALDARMMASEGIRGEGVAYFEGVRAKGLEGIVAKRRDSKYLPGKRVDSWKKIKVSHERPCVVIGWLDGGPDDLKSLLVATDFEDGDGLRYVGKVGSGMTDAQRDELRARLAGIETERAVVACEEEGRRGAHFVVPEVYVLVRYLERTKSGKMRGPTLVSVLAS